MVLYSPYVTHRMAELWPDADRFVPERWVPGEAAHREPVPYSFVPFGGGARRCIGFGLALQELTTAIALCAATVDAVPVRSGPIRPTGVAAVSPSGGVPITIRARPDPASAQR
jgi:cytochrome P450